MIAELGHFALVLALVIALLQATLPLYGVYAGIPALQRFARSSAVMQCFCLILSFAGLIVAFLQNDFTLDYVSRQSNTLLPYYYKISAVWGGHEGSLLLWVLVLSLWGAAVSLFSRSLPLEMVARVLAIIGMVGVALMAFIFFHHKYLRETSSGPGPVLPALRPAAVTRVQVRPAARLEICAARTNGSWQLVEPLVYPAQAVSIEKFLAELEQLVPAPYLTARALRELGKGTLEATFGQKFAEVPPAFARRGDVVMATDGAMGVCVGASAVFLAEEGGLIRLPRATFTHAWRIG